MTKTEQNSPTVSNVGEGVEQAELFFTGGGLEGPPSLWRTPCLLDTIQVECRRSLRSCNYTPGFVQTRASMHQEAGVRTFLVALFALIPNGNHTSAH